jgi:hypothetical protein
MSRYLVAVVSKRGRPRGLNSTYSHFELDPPSMSYTRDGISRQSDCRGVVGRYVNGIRLLTKVMHAGVHRMNSWKQLGAVLTLRDMVMNQEAEKTYCEWGSRGREPQRPSRTR